MANVPTINTPSVELQNAPTPYQSTDAPIAAFGGREAETLQHAVGAAVNFKNLVDESAANDALNQFRADNLKATNDFLGKQGKDAVDAHGAYVSDLNNRKEQLLSNLSFGAQRLLKPHLQSALGSAFDLGESHFRTQNAKWSVDSSNATLDTNLKDGINSRNDPDRLRLLLEHGNGEFDKMRAIFGWDDATTASKKAAWTSRFYGSVVDSYLNDGKVGEAKKLLGAVGDQLDPAMLGAMKNKAQVIGERIDAQRVAAQNNERRKAQDDIDIVKPKIEQIFAKGGYVDPAPLIAKGKAAGMSPQQLDDWRKYLDLGNATSVAANRLVGEGSFLDMQMLVNSSQRAADNAKNPINKDGLYATHQAPGMIEAGTINLRQPQNAPDTDRAVGAVRPDVFEVDGQFVVLPTVDQDGSLLNRDQAVQKYRDTGANFGKFDTAENAKAYAKDAGYQQSQTAAGVTSPEALQLKADANKRALNMQLARFNQNKLGYVFETAPNVAANYNEFVKSNTSEAWSKYQTSVDNRARELGVDPMSIPILPDQAVIGIVGLFKDKHDGKYALQVDDLYKIFGSGGFSRIMPELIKNGLPDGAQIIAQIPDASRRPDFATALERRQANEKLLPNAARDIDPQIERLLTPLIKTMAPGGVAGRDLIDQQRDAIKTLAYDYYLHGKNKGDSQKAAAAAYKVILGDKYEFNGSWRRPLGLNAPSARDMQEMIKQYSAILKDGQVDPLKDETERALFKENYGSTQYAHAAADASSSGQGWFNNNHDTGIRLYYVAKDGRPIAPVKLRGQTVDIYFSETKGFATTVDNANADEMGRKLGYSVSSYAPKSPPSGWSRQLPDPPRPTATSTRGSRIVQ